MQMEDNWPLLTVSKGFFEGIRAVKGGGTGAKGTGGNTNIILSTPGRYDHRIIRLLLALAMDTTAAEDDAGVAAEGGWGDDDLGMDDGDADEFKSVGEEEGDEGAEGGGKRTGCCHGTPCYL